VSGEARVQPARGRQVLLRQGARRPWRSRDRSRSDRARARVRARPLSGGRGPGGSATAGFERSPRSRQNDGLGDRGGAVAELAAVVEQSADGAARRSRRASAGAGGALPEDRQRSRPPARAGTGIDPSQGAQDAIPKPSNGTCPCLAAGCTARASRQDFDCASLKTMSVLMCLPRCFPCPDVATFAGTARGVRPPSLFPMC
jgi:hypothetical protein